MKIFISGGTGFVGGHVCRELLSRGHQLRLLVHSRRSEESSGIEYVTGDVTSAAECAAGAKGCEAVINLVGIIREFPARDITFSRLHVDATRNMLAAAEANGIRRYLQMSALGSRPGRGLGVSSEQICGRRAGGGRRSRLYHLQAVAHFRSRKTLS